MKKIAAIHDLSGYGRASLTVAIPILSYMGYQVCPLPTAILSAHSEYKDFRSFDLTDQMQGIIDHWKELDLHFDALYSGYLASEKQMNIVSGFFDDFSQDDNFILVDPVLGDHGKLYPGMDTGMITGMRELCKKANVITPNLTEAAFLLDTAPSPHTPPAEAIEWCKALSKLGPENIPVIPSGSIALDKALGVGGYPKGRVIEIYGPESSGKTTLAIHAIAEAQKQGGIAAIIDAEHAFDRSYAEKLGVDVENLFISQPDNGEQALEIADQLIRSAAIDIIVIDSVAALTPKAEIEGNMGDSVMGLQARLMSQALRKLTSTISKTNTCCIFINQLRDKIGVMFGNPETTTGGNALKFYSSVRLDIRKIGPIKDGEEILGNHTRVKVVKNKVAPPFRKAEFDIMYGEGISLSGEIVDLGVECNVIKKSGSWFSYGENKLGQGRETVKQLIMDNPELAEELKQKIVATFNGKTDEPELAESANEETDN